MSGRVSNNIFAALQKKKKSSKSKDAAPKEEVVDKHAELERAIFSGPPAAIVSNWADEESDEEWGGSRLPGGAVEEGWNQAANAVSTRSSQMRLAEPQGAEPAHGVHSEDDGDDADVDEEAGLDIEAELGIELPKSDDEEDDEQEAAGQPGVAKDKEAAQALAPSVPLPAAAADPARPLSKKEQKELKKKELQDLEAVLAEMGLESKQALLKEEGEAAAAAATGAAASTKAAKRKQRKERQGEEGCDSGALDAAAPEGDEPGPRTDVGNGESKDGPGQPAAAGNGAAVDLEAVKAAKAALAKKKAASAKKSAAATAAAAAAAEAKAKAKKAGAKDKSHYNQMPTR